MAIKINTLLLGVKQQSSSTRKPSGREWLKAEFGYRRLQRGVLLGVVYRGNPVRQMETTGILALWCQRQKWAATDHQTQQR